MSDGNGKLKVEYVALADLKPWAMNPRQNDAAVESIVKSMERFGYTNPILARRADGRIIAGHTRVKALERIGETHAPVIYLDMDEADADVYALFDNKSTENTAWDYPKLGDVFAHLREIGVDVELTGFGPEEISSIAAGNAAGGTAPLAPGEARKSLAERFVVPPFSVLDARQGYWQERKRAWLALGIKSELGRGDTVLMSAPQVTTENLNYYRNRADGKGRPIEKERERERE